MARTVTRPGAHLNVAVDFYGEELQRLLPELCLCDSTESTGEAVRFPGAIRQHMLIHRRIRGHVWNHHRESARTRPMNKPSENAAELYS
jgi:hypothetical protein